MLYWVIGTPELFPQKVRACAGQYNYDSVCLYHMMETLHTVIHMHTKYRLCLFSK